MHELWHYAYLIISTLIRGACKNFVSLLIGWPNHHLVTVALCMLTGCSMLWLLHARWLVTNTGY